VDLDLRVINPNDPFVRIFGIWVDNPPPDGWTYDLARQNTAAYKTFVQSGDAVRSSLSLSDGKHDVYVSISQDEAGRLGFWTIEGTLDGVKAPTIPRVDHDTIGRYQITVKNGEVVKSSDAELEELREITGLNALAATKEAFIKVKDTLLGKVDEAVDVAKAHKTESGIIGAASLSLAALAVVLSAKGGSKRF
jgi:hypothetical protein